MSDRSMRLANPKKKRAALNKKKSDLNKDGKLSSYEKKRGEAIADSISARQGMKSGGVANHAQLTGFGAVRPEVKKFGK